MIKRKGSKFYVEIFNPKYQIRYCGRVIVTHEGHKAFCTHIKKPYKHFYIKEQGYPINKELLEELYKIKIDYLVIPEDGQTRFKTYLAETKKYLKGVHISEPFTEPQIVIPLRELKEIDIPKKKLEGALYG